MDVEESGGKVGERVTAIKIEKELDNCLTPEPRVFRDGVRCRRGPDDAHPRRRVHRAQDRLLHGLCRARPPVPPREQNYIQVTISTNKLIVYV